VGYYVLWIFRVRFQFFPQLPYNDPQIFEVSAGLPAPNRPGEFLVTDRFVGVIEQILQNIELFWRKMSCIVLGTSYFVCVQIDRATGKNELRF